MIDLVPAKKLEQPEVEKFFEEWNLQFIARQKELDENQE
jgi:hypothetical protein